LSLREALAAGGVVLELAGRTPEKVIAELAAAIPPDSLPPAACIADMALARERDLSTDLGSGVAVPHARCANLKAPVVVAGRSVEGILFSPQSADLVHLVFLFVTPQEQADVQLELLDQLARVAGDEATRVRLRQATSATEVIEILSEKRPSPAD
jgi:mannitol/fructose-specific phosphotransferase system IIA component (Ntr-type)